MDPLNWELSVLARAVAYKNLSNAASQIAISQPQLSRIVAKLEATFDLVLLDREARRKAAWTPAAFKLATAYSDTERQFKFDTQKLSGLSEPKHLRIGTLEGLVPLATIFGGKLFERTGVQLLEMHVYDLSELEERYLNVNLDVIFTSREPGRKKHHYIHPLGFQSLVPVSNSSGPIVRSSFEFASKLRPGGKDARTLVSNSLGLRSHWLSNIGGTGDLPSPVRKARKRESHEEEVLLIGQDQLARTFWDKIVRF